MIDLPCALCKTKNNYAVMFEANFSEKDLSDDIFSARRLPDRLHYRLVRCDTCGLVRSTPILPFKKIESLYKRSTVCYQAEVPYLNKTYGKYLKEVLQLEARTDKFLEIGCGNGFFLSEAKNMGFKNVYGVEPGKAAVDQAPKAIKKNIKIDFFHKGNFPKNTFDVITCFHTIDHVTNPDEFIADTYSMLKNGGYALYIMHDVDAFSARILKERSPIFDIEHIYLFNKFTIRKLFEKNKFSVINIFDVQNSYPLRYWVRMSSLSKGIKSFALSILEKTRLGEIQLTLAGGNMGIIARK